MTDVSRLCPGCMRELQDESGGRCPYCGYAADQKEQNNRCLPVHTILAGKYLVGAVLGQGGFGITYMGYDLNMETRIAIKEYFPVELVSRDTTTMTGDRVLSLGGDKRVAYQQGLKKYVDEARNVSQFSGTPGIVSVKDFFYENETAYIVMEYIEGQSLKDYLKARGGRLSEEETLQIMRPVLEALGKVHEAGIIHRDISPDNIMLTFASKGPEGSEGGADAPRVRTDSGDASGAPQIQNVRLIDFGAARMTVKNNQKSLTIILKHGYAPEEQYRTHGEQGPWTDVYAVCAVLYRMLTGETPVPAMDRLFQDGLKRPEELGVKVSRGTSEAVVKGLAVKKEDRIQSIRELIGVLYEGTKIKETGRKAKGNIYIAAGIGAAAVLAAVGIMAGSGIRKDADQPAVQEETPTEETEGLPGQSVELSEGEILGEQIVFYDPERSIAAANDHVLICLPDGTVTARGDNGSGQCDVEDWTHVAAVRAANSISVGLRTDGTVLYTGLEEGQEEAALWTDLADIQVSNIVMGLRSDGTVVTTSVASWMGPETEEIIREAGTWTGVRAITLDRRTAAALKEDGTILVAGWLSGGQKIQGWENVEYLQLEDDQCGGSMLLGIGPGDSVKMAWLGDEETVRASGYDLAGIEKLREYERRSEAGQLSLEDICAVGVKEDGTVFYNEHVSESIEQELASWQDLAAVKIVNWTDAYGMKTDGTVLEYWENHGNAEPETMADLQWVQVQGGSLYAGTKDRMLLTYGKSDRLPDLYSWREPGKQIRRLVGNYGILYEDGTFTFQDSDAGHDRSYRSVPNIRQAEEIWSGTDINRVWSCAYLCIAEDGTCSLQTGGGWENAVLSEFAADRLSKIERIKDRTDIAQICSLSSAGFFILKTAGSIIRLLDEGEYEMELTEKFVSLYKNDYCVLGLTEQGDVVPVYGEPESMEKGTLQVESWKDITQIAVGESHTAGLCSDGTVVATGRNYAGQCDVEDWTDIVYVAAGKSCTLGITESGTLKLAGSLY